MGWTAGANSMGSASQARRHDTEAAATAVAASFETNSLELEYQVSQLPSKS